MNWNTQFPGKRFRHKDHWFDPGRLFDPHPYCLWLVDGELYIENVVGATDGMCTCTVETLQKHVADGSWVEDTEAAWQEYVAAQRKLLTKHRRRVILARRGRGRLVTPKKLSDADVDAEVERVRQLYQIPPRHYGPFPTVPPSAAPYVQDLML